MPGALEGIRVLDFTIAQQGPYATALLADMGAEVIKVEPPGKGEVGRVLGLDRRTRFSAYFLAINRGKKSLTLDLKSRRGREVALRIARDCDVVVHNFRPGVMERLGLGYEHIRAANPQVVYASASAFGTKGPWGQKAGNDILAQAVSGLMSVTGDSEAPVPAGAAVADTVGALTLALGIVSALVRRQRTGEGQALETSLLGGMLAAQAWELTLHMMTGEKPPKAGRGHTYLLWQWYTFRTSDGWMAIGGIDPTRWTAFCHAIDRPELETDPRFDSPGKRIRDRHELNALLDTHFSTKPTTHWLRALEAADIFCAPVLDYAQVTSHEQTLANGYVQTIAHPRMGQTRIVSCPIDFKGTPADSTRPEPALGQHTEAVLHELGFSDADIEQMRHGGVV